MKLAQHAMQLLSLRSARCASQMMTRPSAKPRQRDHETAQPQIQVKAKARGPRRRLAHDQGRRRREPDHS